MCSGPAGERSVASSLKNPRCRHDAKELRQAYGPSAVGVSAGGRQQRNKEVTEIVEIPNRGHALTIGNGRWKVANTALDFVKRFV
jgi:hypothetical protein